MNDRQLNEIMCDQQDVRRWVYKGMSIDDVIILEIARREKRSSVEKLREQTRDE